MASDLFDPYYNWLGIPPEDQPADHYQLLGLKRFESNPDVISNISDQRISHIRTFQTGKRSAESQKILNELAAATRVLLNAEQKKQYDAELKAKLVATGKIQTAPAMAKPVQAKPIVAKPIAQPIQAEVVTAPAEPVPATPLIVVEKKAERPAAVHEHIPRKSGPPIAILAGVLFFAFILVGGGAFASYWFLFSGAKKVIADTTQPEVPETKPAPSPEQNPPTPKPKTEEVPTTPQQSNPQVTGLTKFWVFEKSPENLSGVIRELYTGVWVELRSDGVVNYFTEKSRDANSVTLHDVNRKMTFLLNPTTMQMQREGSSGWQGIMPGHWAAAAPSSGNSFKPDSLRVNLMSIDWAKLATKGNFAKSGDRWLSTNDGESFSVVEFPIEPRGDFALELVAKRVSGTNSFKLICPHSGKPIQFVLDAHRQEANSQFTSGVNYYQNKHLFTSPAPQVMKSNELHLKQNVDSLIQIVIRRNEIMAWIDGKRIFDWQGNFQDFGMPDDPRTTSNPQRLGLAMNGATFEISKMEYRPLNNRATSSTPTTIPPTPESPVVNSTQRLVQTYLLRGSENAVISWQNLPSEFAPAKPFTLEFWYRHMGSVTDTPALASLGYLNLITLPGDKNPTQQRRYALAVGDMNVSGPEFALDNQWHHIAVCSNTESISLSVDGQPNFSVPWSKLAVSNLQPIEWGKAKASATETRFFRGMLRSLRLSTQEIYPANTAFSPPSSTQGTLLPPGTRSEATPFSRIIPAHVEFNSEQFAGIAGANPAGGNTPANPVPGTTTNPMNSNGPSTPEEMRPKQDLVMSFNGSSKLSALLPEDYLGNDKQATLEFWWRRPPGVFGYYPLFRLGEMNVLLRQSSEGSTVFLYVQGTSSGDTNSLRLGAGEWHHVVCQFNRGTLETMIDGQRVSRTPLSFYTGNNKLNRLEIGQASRSSNAYQLVGDLRSLKIGQGLQYAYDSPPALTYESANHGILIPKQVNLVPENMVTKTSEGSQPPRTTLADLLDENAGQRVATAKVAPPAKEKLDPAKATIATVFGAQIKAAVKPDQKQTLCKELLTASLKEVDPAVAFALLGEARTQSTGSGDVETLLDVVDEVDRRFTIDRLALQAKMLTEMNTTKLSPEQREILAMEAMQCAVQALKAEKIPLADSLSDMATNSAKTSKNAELKKAFRVHRDQIVAAKTLFDQLTKSTETLQQNPDDAAANLLLGRFYALNLENFEKGLPYLSKAGESPLAAAAKKELAAKSIEEKLAATEAWYELIAAAKNHEKVSLQRHAMSNYDLLAQQATGILQSKAKERSKEIKSALEELEKTAIAAKNTKRSSKPQPGLIVRITTGDSRNRIPTPYLGIAKSREDIYNMNGYQYTRGYTSSYTGYTLVGFVIVDKDMEVILSLSDCQCSLDGNRFDANSSPIVNRRVPVKKGKYPILISSYYEAPGFQINRADTGEALLFHTPELLEAELNTAAPLGNGLPSKGIRIDQNALNNN